MIAISTISSLRKYCGCHLVKMVKSGLTCYCNLACIAPLMCYLYKGVTKRESASMGECWRGKLMLCHGGEEFGFS